MRNLIQFLAFVWLLFCSFPAQSADFLGTDIEDREVPTSARQYGFKGTMPIVINIANGSLAERIGLQKGDIIIKVGESLAGRAAYLKNYISSAKSLTVLRGKELGTLSLLPPSGTTQSKRNQQVTPNIYDPPTTPILRIEAGNHSAVIRSVSTDAYGLFVATASDDKTSRLYEVATGRMIRTFRPPIDKGNEGKLNAVALSPDGATLAVGGWTGWDWDGSANIYLFETTSGRLMRRISGLPSIITHLSFSVDGHTLAASLWGNYGIRVFRSSDGSEIGRDTDYGGQSYSVHFAVNGHLVSSSLDGYIRLYDGADGKSPLRLIAKIKPPGGKQPYAARFSPNGSRIAVGYNDSTKVDLLNSMDLSLLFSADTSGVDEGDLGAVAWSADGSTLFAGGRYKKESDGVWQRLVRRWRNEGRGKGEDIPIGFTQTITDLASLAGGALMIGLGDPALALLGQNDQSRFFAKPSIANYTSLLNGFQIASNGSEVRFEYELKGKSPQSFSLARRQLSLIDQSSTDSFFQSPITALPGIIITGWENTTAPKLNGTPLKLDRYEPSRSLAISPDGSRFLLGTEWRLRCFSLRGEQLWEKTAPGAVWGVNIDPKGRIALAAYGDGTIRWHRMSDGEELLAFFPHIDRKRWVLWTPEGYFDASPGGTDLIGYHINQGKDKEARFIPISYLYDVFYRPDIVQAKFKGEDISGLVTLTAVEALKTPPPEVKFTSIPKESPDSKAKVCYQIKSTGGGIGEVRLFQNGKLIKSDGFYREVAKKESTEKIQLASLNSRAIYNDQRGLVVKEKQTATFALTKPKGELVDECVEIETIAGENEISLAAFNAPNTVQGFMDTVTFTSTRKPDEPHLYILSVGIDTYRDSSINLKYAAKDAKDFIAKLPEKARSIYKPENIHLITLADQQAGKRNIMKTIDDLSAMIKHGDGFIFFNASHGVLLQNQYYIVTADYNGDLNNTNTLISSNEIVEMSKRIKSLSQLFIFDTCHAGGVDNIVSGLYDARMSVLAKKMGLHIYASAGSVQTALDGYKGNGLYTHTLLQGIANGKEVDREKSGKVTVKNLGQYSKEKTTEISTKLGHPQTPFIINFGRDNPLFEVR